MSEGESPNIPEELSHSVTPPAEQRQPIETQDTIREAEAEFRGKFDTCKAGDLQFNALADTVAYEKARRYLLDIGQRLLVQSQNVSLKNVSLTEHLEAAADMAAIKETIRTRENDGTPYLDFRHQIDKDINRLSFTWANNYRPPEQPPFGVHIPQDGVEYAVGVMEGLMHTIVRRRQQPEQTPEANPQPPSNPT